MQNGNVARRYAKALFEIAVETNAVLGVSRELERIAAVVAGSRELTQSLADPRLARERRLAIWREVQTRLGLGPLMRNFCGLVFDKGRLEHLPLISRQFLALVDDKENRVRAEVQSARPLPEAALGELRLALQRQTGKTVVLTQKTNPELIGGMVAQVGNWIFDGSLRTQIERLSESMLGRRA